MNDASQSVQGLSIAQMLRPDAYPHPVDRIELVETHVSWVILTGAFAYKIKKPVRFDFIDSSTLKRRRRLCEEEMRLNRRLAPDLYLEVVPIGWTPAGARVDSGDPILEYAVRMRQFDRRQELAALLERRDVACHELADLAARIAAFHEHAPVARSDSPHGDFEQVRDVVSANLGSLASMCHDADDGSRLHYLSTWMDEALARLRTSIEFRKLNGAVRECHGDLHAHNIVRWDARLTPFDCLEFDPMLRWIDTANELAFLYMDLIAHGRRDLASVAISRYLEVCGDYEILRLLRMYSVHRALVRAKVEAIRLHQATQDVERVESVALFRARIDLALRLSQAADPMLILMHGVSGSGKSWISEQLVPSLGAVRVRSDLERKRIAGLAPTDRIQARVGAGVYAREYTDRTYARLAECAEHALAGGLHVIVDAAFLDGDQRTRFLRLARERGRRSLILACTAEREVMRSRIAARAAEGSDASDADIAVLNRQYAELRPFTDAERFHVVDVDTTHLESAASVADIVRKLSGTGSKPGNQPAWR